MFNKHQKDKKKIQENELELERIKSQSVLEKKNKMDENKHNGINLKLPDLQANANSPNSIDKNNKSADANEIKIRVECKNEQLATNENINDEQDASITANEIEDETDGKTVNDIDESFTSHSTFDNGEILYNDNRHHDRDAANDFNFEFVNWTEKEVLLWLKITFDNNGIDTEIRKTFLTEFATKNINGEKLNQYRNNVTMLNQFSSTFELKHQTFQIWSMIKSSLNNLT